MSWISLTSIHNFVVKLNLSWADELIPDNDLRADFKKIYGIIQECCNLCENFSSEIYSAVSVI